MVADVGGLPDENPRIRNTAATIRTARMITIRRMDFLAGRKSAPRRRESHRKPKIDEFPCARGAEKHDCRYHTTAGAAAYGRMRRSYAKSRFKRASSHQSEASRGDHVAGEGPRRFSGRTNLKKECHPPHGTHPEVQRMLLAGGQGAVPGRSSAAGRFRRLAAQLRARRGGTGDCLPQL